MSTARFLVGDSLEVLQTLPAGSVDLVMTSPPFLALRSYLPDDDPAKAQEMGSEPTPGEFLDRLLDVTDELRRVLAPHGSLVVELGDTYSGSGGAGGDYGEGGLRDGQPRVPSQRKGTRPKAGPGLARYSTEGHPRTGERTRRDRDGWPLDKSLCLVPELYRLALAYGVNPLTGREVDRWRLRNVVRWVRPNPPVGALSDKFRNATSDLVVATLRRDRYFDGDAVRVPRSPNSHARKPSTNGPKSVDAEDPAHRRKKFALRTESETAPLLDWWKISTEAFPGRHYATFPTDLVVPVVESMAPRRVCRTCGEPSRRIVATANGQGKGTRRNRSGDGHRDWLPSTDVPDHAERVTEGWTDCGHDDWRRGLVLDPFAGSGTVLQVATGHGRDAIGIDLDARNAELALGRVGMFLEVEDRRPTAAPG